MQQVDLLRNKLACAVDCQVEGDQVLEIGIFLVRSKQADIPNPLRLYDPVSQQHFWAPLPDQVESPAYRLSLNRHAPPIQS